MPWFPKAWSRHSSSHSVTPGGTSGQLLGIATRRIDSGFGEQRRSRVDCAPQDSHACCNRDCLSAALSASADEGW